MNTIELTWNQFMMDFRVVLNGKVVDRMDINNALKYRDHVIDTMYPIHVIMSDDTHGYFKTIESVIS